MAARRMNRSRLDPVVDAFIYLFMIISGAVFLYPFWDTLVLSFSSPQAALALKIRLWPGEWSLGAYREVFRSEVVYIGYYNTIYRTVVGTAITVVVTFCGAYVLSKRALPFRSTITVFILFTMFFHGGLIPHYWLVRSLGLLNSRWALILPTVTTAWYLVIARNFIMSLPDSMEEAAVIDGAHPLVIAFRIILPLSAPIIAVLALWHAVYHWNEWFHALIYVRDRNKMVLQLVLRRILIEQSLGDEMMGNILVEQTTTTTPETVKAATIIVSIGPIIALYPFLQKYFVKGVMVGALKG